MHPRIYQEFERICAERKIGGSVLEIGAIPSNKGLLFMRSLANATNKVGINLDGPHEFQGINILKGNANCMDAFPDNCFDAVFCNAMLEHDKYFWKTTAEIKRVTKVGGIAVIGVPGYVYYEAERIKQVFARTPLVRRLARNRYFNMLFVATITFQVHDAPGDYYRFSRQAVTEVLLADFIDVDVRSIMLPPRIIGVGRKGPG